MPDTPLPQPPSPPAGAPPELPAYNEEVLSRVAPGEWGTPEEILRKQLVRQGEKYTMQRRQILVSVLNTHGHFHSDWLFMDVKRRGVQAAKATVYRTLRVLCDCHLIREVFHGPHGAYFEHIYGHGHHEHMICENCGKVIEFGSRELEILQDEACRAHGFHARQHHLQIFGYCSDCHPCGANFPPRRSPEPAAQDPAAQPFAFSGDGALRQAAPGQQEAPESILRRQLARNGEKYTAQRRDILMAVLNSHEHFHSDWLYNRVQVGEGKAAKATVYRTLRLLCECRLIREVYQGDHGAYYERIYGHQHHEHMLCAHCGKVVEFTSRRLEQLQDRACHAHGFHATRHQLQIEGYCSDCHPCQAALPPPHPQPAPN